MANFITGIISLSIGVVVMSGVFIQTVKGTNTGVINTTPFYNCATHDNCTSGGFTSAELALWGLLTIAGIAGIVYGVLNVFGIA